MSGCVKLVELDPLVDKGKSECLNEDDDHTWLNVIEESATGELKSDCDEQLILRVEFTQPVKLHSLVIEAGCDAEQAPKEIRLFANETSPISFDDAEQRKSTQDFDLSFEELSKPIEVRFVKFQKVNNITIFFKNNQGDQDVTSMSKVQFIGSPIATTNMSELKKVG
ncbi:Oidioi.mRNA.OKI2018_I69.chr2.g7664.t1.cds [Oikopleura dioica]|uniref:Oidioi.mRNA.OKI2018_I69.chr2.g7664.t1.cds n=1 Tax=Oikopleura dioica TaxID=34765 RepID=A0ABN7T6X2_OIKDI|nr:Oidioi.mRNA.OKI2018_I69.chr2.g7664.t1.cds [Oikopleura dioica]